MKIFAVDPGQEKSGFVIYDSETQQIVKKGIEQNEPDLTLRIQGTTIADILVIEKIESFGMSVGQSVFDTCVWIGRFVEIWRHKYIGILQREDPFYLMPRKEVKLQICGTLRAKDKNIRQALIDRFPAIGGGKIPQIGTKSEPGLLYKMSSHMWSALALAVAYAELYDVQG